MAEWVMPDVVVSSFPWSRLADPTPLRSRRAAARALQSLGAGEVMSDDASE